MHPREIKIDEVISIARDAGTAILSVYHDEQQHWEVQSKADDSPLTLADQKANSVICEALQRLYPEIPILSEENKQAPYEERKDWNLFWLVDPLDGTKEFIKRNGEFTVNIALIESGTPILGVVYVPVSDDMYFAEKGKGAYIVRSDDTKEQLFGKGFEKGQKGVKIVCSRSHMNTETSNFVAQFESPVLISAGSSLKFMLVSKGDAHVYPRLAPTMEWDTAAAQAVVTESGGRVIDAQTGEALQYNKEVLLNPNFIVHGK